MARDLDTSNSKESTQKSKRDEEQSLTQKTTCYRGFTSIDQEMEREIAMQWFKPRVKADLTELFCLKADLSLR